MGNSMKEMPESVRPYEKCMRYGPDALDDAELLAVILRTGTKDENAVELAPAFRGRADVYPGDRDGKSSQA